MDNGDAAQQEPEEHVELDGLVLGFGVLQNTACIVVQCAGERTNDDGEVTGLCGTELAMQLPEQLAPPESEDQPAYEQGVPCPSCTEYYGKQASIPLAMLIGHQVLDGLDDSDELDGFDDSELGLQNDDDQADGDDADDAGGDAEIA